MSITYIGRVLANSHMGIYESSQARLTHSKSTPAWKINRDMASCNRSRSKPSDSNPDAALLFASPCRLQEDGKTCRRFDFAVLGDIGEDGEDVDKDRAASFCLRDTESCEDRMVVKHH
jgi:hypothetical protein